MPEKGFTRQALKERDKEGDWKTEAEWDVKRKSERCGKRTERRRRMMDTVR